MSQWGNKDSKTATGTVTITKNSDGVTGNVVGSSTLFQTEAAVGDVIASAGNTYVITSITSNTACFVVSGIHGANVVAQTGGSAYALSEKPISVAVSEASENKSATSIYGNLENVYGVDVAEMQAARAGAGAKPAHSGWVRKVTGTGGRSGRVSMEVLVAGGSITGDAEDAVFYDYYLFITTQPADTSGNTTAGESVTFTVVPDSTPTGATFAYLWQYTTDPGNTATWATTAAVSGFSGQTSNVLTVNTAIITGDGTLVRVLVSSANGAANAISDPATLTVTS